MRTIPKLFQKLVFGTTSVLQNREERMQIILGSLFIEAAAVGVVCFVFLILFVVAGVWQRRKNGKY
jgi:hypothetical protein